MKKLIFSFCILIFTAGLSAQTIDVPSTALSDISFEINGKNFPDTLRSFQLTIFNNDYSFDYDIKLVEGSFDTVLTIYNAGNFRIAVSGIDIKENYLTVIPGILSIIPPLLAIVLALLFRQVIISLILGIFSGALFINGFNPITAFLRLIDKYIVEAVSDVSHTQIIIFTLLFGGVVGLISKS